MLATVVLLGAAAFSLTSSVLAQNTALDTRAKHTTTAFDKSVAELQAHGRLFADASRP